MPVLLYGLDVCLQNASDLRFVDFVINRIVIKLFNTNVIGTVKLCQRYFDSDLSEERRKTFLARFEIVEILVLA